MTKEEAQQIVLHALQYVPPDQRTEPEGHWCDDDGFSRWMTRLASEYLRDQCEVAAWAKEVKRQKKIAKMARKLAEEMKSYVNENSGHMSASYELQEASIGIGVKIRTWVSALGLADMLLTDIGTAPYKGPPPIALPLRMIVLRLARIYRREAGGRIAYGENGGAADGPFWRYLRAILFCADIPATDDQLKHAIRWVRALLAKDHAKALSLEEASSKRRARARAAATSGPENEEDAAIL